MVMTTTEQLLILDKTFKDAIKRHVKKFWEKASLWSDENEVIAARKELENARKKLDKFRNILRDLPPEKDTKTKAELRREEEIASQTFRTPALFGTRRQRLERIIARLEHDVEMAEAHLEGARERREHARRELMRVT